MKFFHISDLHFGKKVNGFSMEEEQKNFINILSRYIENEKPQAVIIAGDIFDKSQPSDEAVRLYDSLINELSKKNIHILITSGNHDSAAKIACGSSVMAASKVYISPEYDGNIKSVKIEDGENSINFFLLPFIRPGIVKSIFKDCIVEDYTDALKLCLSKVKLDKKQTNILIAHQFVTGAKRSDSEEISVGTVENVEFNVFDDFDYVALGHLHNPQSVGRKEIRYSGSPIKYSFSECSQEKSITLIETNGKNINISTLPLKPIHQMRELKGTYEALTNRENYINTAIDDYLHITLTDEEEVMDALEKLRSIYPNIMCLDYNNTRTHSEIEIEDAKINSATPLEMFSEFYTQLNNCEMTKEQTTFISNLIEEIWNKNE